MIPAIRLLACGLALLLFHLAPAAAEGGAAGATPRDRFAGWLLVTGDHGSPDAVGATMHGTTVRLPHFTLGTAGAVIGLQDRIEFSYHRQRFDTGRTGGRLGHGNGDSFEQDIIGGKLRLRGDLMPDQDTLLPQLAVGLQYKVSANWDVVRPAGRRDAAADAYLSATKLLLAQGLLLNGTLRFTRANQFGLPGGGGDTRDAYRPQFEASAAWLATRRIAFGAEYRSPPDGLRFVRERAGYDVFGTWSLNHNIALVLAYAEFGGIANQGRQNILYLSLRAGF